VCNAVALAAIVTLCATLAAPHAAGAQDIEVAARVLARTLPQGYFDRIDDDHSVFQLKGGWIAKAELASAMNEAVTGEFPLLVVPAYFADSSEPTVSQAELQRVLFDGPNPAGTLSEFYAVSSRGMFTIRGHVSPWVRTSITAAQVRGNSFGLGDDSRVGEFLIEALELADQTVDFTAFDNDGPDGVPNSGDDDGVVDALSVEFLEAALTCQGQGPTIWGHRSRIESWTGAPFRSADTGANGMKIRANDYIVQPAERCDGRVQTAVVIAHEFGHALGLPDLYDQTEGIQAAQRNWVVGCWSIMAAGQWGCGPALAEGRWDRPTHFGPWEKSQLGWLPDMVTVGDVLDQEFTLRPVETSGDVLRVDLSPTEHLLIEYRDGSGFDTNLPGTGLLVHHIDATRITGARRCRGCPRIYRTTLLEADGDFSLRIPEGEGGSRGEAGDIFSDAAVHAITNTTFPSTRLNSGAPSDVSIYRMEVVDGVAKVRLSSRTVTLDALLAPFFEDAPTDGGPGDPSLAPTALEQAYLDGLGNQNGRFDLGDLSRYLTEHPSVVARAKTGGS
jgi:M6 family metalloprotease-like protein